MPIVDLIVLYVAKPLVSAEFYSKLLGEETVASSENFAMVPLGAGIMLGLWSTAAVEPPPSAIPGGSEIAFRVKQPDEVDALYARWQDRGASVLQPPHDAGFGRNFLAADPDGHRLRVLFPT